MKTNQSYSLFLRFIVSIHLYTFFIMIPATQAKSPPPEEKKSIESYIKNGGVYVESKDGKALLNLSGDDAFVPASTLKVITALVALENLGPDYRFKTEFYLDDAKNLTIKGYGDPSLVSEELNVIAYQLKKKGLKKINSIYLDESFFDPITIPGVSASNNPYDALNSALSVNFNTIYVVKSARGVESAESQTPMTELTQELAQKAPKGKSRINLASKPEQSLLYVGYLMKAFLNQEGIEVAGKIQKKKLSSQAKLFYQHLSTKTLTDVTQSMLEFSTNFIANQLFLIVGAEQLGAPANLNKSRKIFTEFLKNRVGLKNFVIDEGSGLSRENKISPKELVKVLRAFDKYQGLLPEKLQGIYAKTGTLNGVSCLAGYFDSEVYKQIRFVILLNQTGAYREKIAKALYEKYH